MKRTKIKLSLNSQTIRRLSTPALKDVNGGLVDMPEDGGGSGSGGSGTGYCPSINVACGRGCG